MEHTIKQEWLTALLKCTENSFIIDENTKKLLWSNDDMLPVGSECYRALFGKETPCVNCPMLKAGDVYSWDCYNQKSSSWIKIKYMLFFEGDRALRAGNTNEISDMMGLSCEAVDGISTLEQLLADNQRIKQALEHSTSHDHMTGLSNRNKFNEDIAAGLFDKAGTGILFIDLNDLKTTNDRLGHEAGDRLICCLASAIAQTAAELSSATAYRIGGDEFVILLPNCTRDSLRHSRELFLRKLAEQECTLPCTAAVGEAFSAKPCCGEHLISDADKAMYEDKRRIKQKRQD